MLSPAARRVRAAAARRSWWSSIDADQSRQSPALHAPADRVSACRWWWRSTWSTWPSATGLTDRCRPKLAERELGVPVDRRRWRCASAGSTNSSAAMSKRARRRPRRHARPRSPPDAAREDLIAWLQRRARAIALRGDHRARQGARALERTGSIRLRCIRSFGPLLLAALLFVIFQAVFAWATSADGRDHRRPSTGSARLGEHRRCQTVSLRNLLNAGRDRRARCAVIVTFLPQILILFLFILLPRSDRATWSAPRS